MSPPHHDPSSTSSPGGLGSGRLALLALVLFVYLTAEVFTVGALPQMSDDLGVAPGEVGQLLTVYALVAAVTTLPVAWATRRIDHRVLLTTAMALLAVGTIAMALAPSLAWAAGTRAVTATAHGVVWAGVPVVAARLSGPGAAGRSTALVLLGSSLGGIAGPPMVAAASQATSWRLAALVLAGLAAVCAVLLRALLPALPRHRTRTPQTHRTGRRPGAGAVAIWALVTVMVAAAHYLAYPYLSVILAGWGVQGSAWTLFLLLFGAAGVVGTWAMGRVNDRAPMSSTAVALGVLVPALGAAALSGPPLGLLACLVWAVAYGAGPVAFQAGTIRDAPGWSHTASAIYVLAFQVGIATGSWAGGTLLEATGATTLLGVAAGVCAGGFLVISLRWTTSAASREAANEGAAIACTEESPDA